MASAGAPQAEGRRNLETRPRRQQCHFQHEEPSRIGCGYRSTGSLHADSLMRK